MSKYKVGDVAALFPKPKEPTTEAGKKLQSLFSEFHSKKTKFHAQSFQNTDSKQKKILENEIEETENQSNSKKSKKRKFSVIISEELNNENTTSKRFMETNEQEYVKSAKIDKKKKKDNITEKDFPRKKKKLSKINSDAFDRNGFIESEVNENPISENRYKSNDISKSKNNKKDNKQVSGFIRKSKNKKHAAEKMFCEEVSDNSNDDSLIRGEIEEILQQNAEKYNSQQTFTSNTISEPKNNSKKNKELPDFIKKQKHAATNNSIGNHNSKISNKEAFDNNDTLFKNEIGESLQKSSKKLKKKKNSDNSTQNSQQTLFTSSIISEPKNDLKDNKEVPDFIRRPKQQKYTATNSVGNQDNKMSNKEVFDNSNILFKSELGEPLQKRAKKLKKNDVNFMQIPGSKTYNQSKQDFIKLPNLKSDNVDEEEKLRRTLFVGNLPINTTRKALKTLFSPFGELQQIRYYGIETDKAKIFSEDTPKSLSPNYAADSIPGYIVFKKRENAVDALSLSGCLFKEHHITVDLAIAAGTKRFYDSKRSVFLGNLPFDIKDESIWEAFSGCGRIEGVRIVRDRQTGIGKGFGYVLFSTVQSKENALALHNLEIQGRGIRIKAINSNKDAQNKSDDNRTFKRDTFKSRAIRDKKKNKDSTSRKSIKKIIKKNKSLHQKKKIASILQKSMKW